MEKKGRLTPEIVEAYSKEFLERMKTNIAKSLSKKFTKETRTPVQVKFRDIDWEKEYKCEFKDEAKLSPKKR